MNEIEQKNCLYVLTLAKKMLQKSWKVNEEYLKDVRKQSNHQKISHSTAVSLHKQAIDFSNVGKVAELSAHNYDPHSFKTLSLVIWHSGKKLVAHEYPCPPLLQTRSIHHILAWNVLFLETPKVKFCLWFLRRFHYHFKISSWLTPPQPQEKGGGLQRWCWRQQSC